MGDPQNCVSVMVIHDLDDLGYWGIPILGDLQMHLNISISLLVLFCVPDWFKGTNAGARCDNACEPTMRPRLAGDGSKVEALGTEWLVRFHKSSDVPMYSNK